MSIIKKEDFFNFLLEEQKILTTQKKSVSDFLDFLKSKINSDQEIVAILLTNTIDISINSSMFDCGLLKLEANPITKTFQLFYNFGSPETSFDDKSDYFKAKIANLVLNLIDYIREWEKLILLEELGDTAICKISLTLEEHPELIQQILNIQNLKASNFTSITCQIKVFGDPKDNEEDLDFDFEWI